MTWQDVEAIGLALYETHPTTDPLTVRFTQMHDWVITLPDFKDDPKKSNEKILEGIQMSWYEEWKDNQ
jgi:FeS assembly protein IscX